MSRQECINSSRSVCTNGQYLPYWEPAYPEWGIEKAAKSFSYLCALCYVFLGVSIVTDRFMCAIEMITSQERDIEIKTQSGEKYVVQVKKWNETVSNLTLALGSSAPEILISVIEIIGSDFKAGALGPGTIVGSAAFNLFIIIAACIIAIPSVQVRRIRQYNVFVVTMVWSVFAYIWLYLIVSVISPNKVDVWEGFLTFAFFPMTVGSAYLVDRGFHKKILKVLRRPKVRPDSAENIMSMADFANMPDPNLDPEAYAFEQKRRQELAMMVQLRKDNPDIDQEVLDKIIQESFAENERKSRTLYRNQQRSQDIVVTKSEEANIIVDDIESHAPEVSNQVYLWFEPYHYTCHEDVGKQVIFVMCERIKCGLNEDAIAVDYHSRDGTATAPGDYIESKGTLIFRSPETQKRISIEIVDNEYYEEDKHFYVHLSNPRISTTSYTRLKHSDIKVDLKTPFVATVLILDNDHSGVFQISESLIEVSESVNSVEVEVVRKKGSRGEVIVPYYTMSGKNSARENEDYIPVKGELHYGDDESSRIIRVPILNSNSYEKDVHFFICLDEPVWKGEPDLSHVPVEDREAALRGKPVLGDMAKCKIRIRESAEFRGFIDRVRNKTKSKLVNHKQLWLAQVKNAFVIEFPKGSFFQAFDEHLVIVSERRH